MGPLSKAESGKLASPASLEPASMPPSELAQMQESKTPDALQT
jgi:hypothetical protein